MYLIGRARGVDQASSFVAGDQLLIATSYRLEEFASRGLEAIALLASGLLSSPALLYREVEHQIEIRNETVGRETIQSPHLVQIQPPAVPLIGVRRQREPVGDEQFATLEYRLHDLSHERRPRGQIEQQLRLTRHREFGAILYHVSDRLAHVGAPGLPGQLEAHPTQRQPLGQKTGLDCLPGPLHAFQHQEGPTRLQQPFIRSTRAPDA